jgi:uncharacterized protein
MTEREAVRLVAELGLKPHPEGGFFSETYRSAIDVRTPSATRAAMTSIYYLLSATNFSAFHRVRSDEIWHHYRGAPVAIESIDEGGEHRCAVIGEEDRWQCAVPAGTWFAAHVRGESAYALVGCDVAPGFDFADFELAGGATLAARFPRHQALIERFTRP